MSELDLQISFMKISEEEKESFHSQGFLLIPNAISEIIIELEEECDSLLDLLRDSYHHLDLVQDLGCVVGTLTYSYINLIIIFYVSFFFF